MMIDMTSWEDLTADVVEDLHLDPDNVRLELKADVPEADIIQDLFQNEKAMDLVVGISKIGYFTHDIPIVVQRSTGLFVVEGNRRLAALKAIQNPYLVPSFQSRINKAIVTIPDRNRLRKIAVKRAPNQEDANQLIGALHTGNQRLAWSPARQAAFFEAQLRAGRTVAQLISDYPTVDVKDFVNRAAVLQLFKDVKYKDPKLAAAVNSARDFKVTVLERLSDNEDFRKLAKITVDLSTGRGKVTGNRERFAALAEKIVSDIVRKVQNTRTLNKADLESYREYMTELKNLVKPFDEPKQSGSKASAGSPPAASASPNAGNTSASVTSGASGQSTNSSGSGTSATSPPTGTGTKKRRTKSAYLPLSALSIPSTFPSQFNIIFDELSRLSVESFPNASADLLRTVLEKSIKSYADSLGVDIAAALNIPAGKGFVQLKQSLQWIEEEARKDNKRALAQVIKKVRDNFGVDYASTSDHLNAINHNNLVTATPDDVRNAWSTVEPLIKWILRP